jgi:hypothetical protein
MKQAAVNEIQTTLSRLDDYVRGREDDADVGAYEEELFGRALAGDAPELAFHAGLGATLRVMNARGSLDIWLTARDVERVRSSGLKTVLYEYNPDDPQPLDIPAGTDLLITRIPLPLEGVRSIEAEIYSSEGRLLKRMPDILFDPGDGAVYACCEADLARTAASTPQTVTKVWVVTEAERRLLAQL